MVSGKATDPSRLAEALRLASGWTTATLGPRTFMSGPTAQHGLHDLSGFHPRRRPDLGKSGKQQHAPRPMVSSVAGGSRSLVAPSGSQPRERPSSRDPVCSR